MAASVTAGGGECVTRVLWVRIALFARFAKPVKCAGVNVPFILSGQGSGMVIRRRLRAVLIPLALYAVSGSAASYFVWHAYNGSRGLKAKEEYRQKIEDLSARLNSLKDEREGWERRVSMMAAETIDRDLLEEQARVMLGRVQKDELVFFFRKSAR
jgi:cell division protein FtsB